MLGLIPRVFSAQR